MATEKEVAKALITLASAYPNKDLPEETIKIYTRLLMDLEFELLKAATLQCISTCTFFPTVAELRAAAVELEALREKVPSPDEAWGLVQKEIQRVGSYNLPDFSHHLISEVVERFGWRNLCLSTDQTADRARFMDAYAEQLKNHRKQMQMLPEVRDIVHKRALDVGNQIAMLANKFDPENMS